MDAIVSYEKKEIIVYLDFRYKFLNDNIIIEKIRFIIKLRKLQ